jgi:hypothetical protein
MACEMILIRKGGDGEERNGMICIFMNEKLEIGTGLGVIKVMIVEERK